MPVWLDRAAAWSWRVLVVAAALALLLWVVGRLWPMFLPLVVAAFLSRILAGPAQWLRAHGWRPGLAAGAVLVGFLLVLAAALAGVGAAVAGETDDLGPTVGEAVDDLEGWLVDDSPFDVSRSDVEQFREDAGDAVNDAARGSSGSLVSGAVIVFEVLAGLLIGLIVTFFALKDGERFVARARGLLPEHRRELADRTAARAWRTLGGYLKGAALLGLVEGVIIGVTLTLVGAELAIPVALLTFLAAFVPFVGAIVAGALATLVALATAGPFAAAIVLVVAIVVQQLDNDLLAPLVYGRALALHPVVILLAIIGGGAAFGIVGSVMAVPVTAVALNVADEIRTANRSGDS